MTGITIPGVPETITQEKVYDLIKSLGMDPKEVCALRFDPIGIHVEVYARDANGNRFTADGKDLAMHKLTIRIV